MKNTILLFTLATTISLTANSFENMNTNMNIEKVQEQTSQKYFYAKRAAERGNARAQFDLGLMYANGNGVEKNEALALMWFNRASQNNFSKPVASKRVHHIRTQVPTTRNVQRVSQRFTFAKEAASRGNARAQFDLGMMYSKGDGVRKNDTLAFNYFHKAARNDSVEAKFQMGLNFAQGRGVRQQSQLARYWFKLAAKAGHSQAMAHLASLERANRPVNARTSRVASSYSTSAVTGTF